MSFDFISEYTDFHKRLTDSSQKYARLIAYATLGFYCGRSSYVAIAPSSVYLNFYIMIVGESTLSHKTSALKIVKRIVPEDDLVPDHFSPESLYDVYSDNAQRIMLFEEISEILKKAGRKNSFMSHIIEDLEKMYDCPDVFKSRVRNKGKEVVARNCFLTVVGAITPEALIDNISDEMLDGGFYPRFLICWEQNPNPQPRQDLPIDLNERTLKLSIHLQKLRCSNYKFNFQPKDALQAWTLSMIRRDRASGAIVGRYETYIIKIASLIAVNEHIMVNGFSSEVMGLVQTGRIEAYIKEMTDRSKNGEVISQFPEIRVEVTYDHFVKARTIVEEIYKDSVELKNKVTDNRILKSLYRIMRNVETIKHSDFLRKTGLVSRDFKTGIETLIDSKELCMYPDEGVTCYCVAKPDKCMSCSMTNQSSEVSRQA